MALTPLKGKGSITIETAVRSHLKPQPIGVPVAHVWLYCSVPFKSLGPRPDLDPDVVAALDDALDLDDPDNILEDDFVVKVTIKSGDQFIWVNLVLQICT